MVLRPRERENRIREIRNTLHLAQRSQTPTGALHFLKEADAQLTILINLETTEGDGHDNQADPGRTASAETPR